MKSDFVGSNVYRTCFCFQFFLLDSLYQKVHNKNIFNILFFKLYKICYSIKYIILLKIHHLGVFNPVFLLATIIEL